MREILLPLLTSLSFAALAQECPPSPTVLFIPESGQHSGQRGKQQKDGQPLSAGEGPFRVITPKDKKPARWIREVRSIKIAFAKN